MHKRAKRAFTLIEVIVAVLIISVVISALLQMFANNTHIFSQLTKQIKTDQYISLLISNSDYGLETKSLTLNDLVSDFNLEDNLRKELKNSKIKIVYQTIEKIDLSKYSDTNRDDIDSMEGSDEADEETTTDIVLEIGKTVVKVNDSSAALFRVKVDK